MGEAGQAEAVPAEVRVQGERGVSGVAVRGGLDGGLIERWRRKKCKEKRKEKKKEKN